MQQFSRCTSTIMTSILCTIDVSVSYSKTGFIEMVPGCNRRQTGDPDVGHLRTSVGTKDHFRSAAVDWVEQQPDLLRHLNDTKMTFLHFFDRLNRSKKNIGNALDLGSMIIWIEMTVNCKCSLIWTKGSLFQSFAHT